MKAVWKGSVAFGLVNIPIKLYSAVESRAVNFRLLHEKDNSPIHYERICNKCGKKVPWNEVVKGVEYAKGKYAAITKEKLEKLKPEKSDFIEIVEFVDMASLDPIFFDKHYYVVPSQKKEKAYFLFKDVLASTAKVAIGRFVMREREYVCAIESYKKGLLLTTLNYAYEIRDISKLEELKQKPKISSKEKKLAKDLINKMYEEEFKISEFKDTFAEKIKPLVKNMMKGEKVGKVKPAKKKKVPEKTLMKALKASIEK